MFKNVCEVNSISDLLSALYKPKKKAKGNFGWYN